MARKTAKQREDEVLAKKELAESRVGIGSSPAQVLHVVGETEEKQLPPETEDKALTEDKCGGYYDTYVPWGVTSFSQYDAYKQANETAKEYRQQVYVLQDLISNIMYDTEVPNKTKALNSLISEFSSRVGEVDNKESDPPAPEPMPREKFMVWKEATGEYRWFAIYSNNYQDDSKPAEVISEKAHKDFALLANEEVVPMPELWTWHVEGTRWGVAQHLMYDDGFAMAFGIVDEGHEKEAAYVASTDGWGVSHGMWKKSLIRDPNDPSIIDFYISREISVLPVDRAANKLTGFIVLPEN